jgi:hypothetical protein
VNSIPSFTPENLPFWDIYVREKNTDVKIGGTMAGEFTAGLSGGQRKLLLFELIYQRTLASKDLLICLDEPFAGVTDDFVPFIIERLKVMSQTHNLLLVTNDHVQTLKDLADNIITVSAIDRKHVKVNTEDGNKRELVIQALSSGEKYVHAKSADDLKFFIDVEIKGSAALKGIAGFTIVSFLLFIVSYWDSKEGSEPLSLVAIQIVAYFCLNPYLLSLVDWRNFMVEEAEALMHSSVRANQILKTCLTTFLLIIISIAAFGTLNLVIDSRMSEAKYFVGMLFDSFSLTIAFMTFGIFTNLPFEAVQIIASMPFLLMIFFSTTFSPGAGVEGVKALRFLFPRFYLWCMTPNVGDLMEGCPDDDMNLFLLVLTGFFILFIFVSVKLLMRLKKQGKNTKEQNSKKKNAETPEFQKLRQELILKHKKEGGVIGFSEGNDSKV